MVPCPGPAVRSKGPSAHRRCRPWPYRRSRWCSPPDGRPARLPQSDGPCGSGTRRDRRQRRRPPPHGARSCRRRCGPVPRRGASAPSHSPGGRTMYLYAPPARLCRRRPAPAAFPTSAARAPARRCPRSAPGRSPRPRHRRRRHGGVSPSPRPRRAFRPAPPADEAWRTGIWPPRWATPSPARPGTPARSRCVPPRRHTAPARRCTPRCRPVDRPCRRSLCVRPGPGRA